jgi:hypothetical protein
MLLVRERLTSVTAVTLHKSLFIYILSLLMYPIHVFFIDSLVVYHVGYCVWRVLHSPTSFVDNERVDALRGNRNPYIEVEQTTQ